MEQNYRGLAKNIAKKLDNGFSDGYNIRDLAKMMTMINGQRKSTERGKTKILKLGTWNIRSLNGKENERMLEFENAQLDILALSETKKKGQGLKKNGGHILVHSGVPVEKRAAEGVASIINKKFKEFNSERILKLEVQQHFPMIEQVGASLSPYCTSSITKIKAITATVG